VANKFLEQVELADNERKETIHIVKYFHQSTIRLSERYLSELNRHNYVTPTSYLELINSFKNLLSAKQDDTMRAKRRYVVGLEKLAFAASQVSMNLFTTLQHQTLTVYSIEVSLHPMFVKYETK
jgi:dynein heavy chain